MSPRIEHPISFLACLPPALLITLGLVWLANSHFRLATAPTPARTPGIAALSHSTLPLSPGLPSPLTVCTLN